VSQLDARRVRGYFSSRNTVATWWSPEEGPLAFHYDAELAVLDDHLSYDPAWRVLDVGTGRGRFGAHFAARGCRVTGVDLNPDMLEIARENARRRGVADRFDVREASADDLGAFGERDFDVVLCMELFDHLPDLGAALREMRGRLAPGGRFLFTYVPSESLYGFLGNLYRSMRGLRRRGSDMISRTYSLPEIRRLLSEQDLLLERYWGVGVLCANAQTRLFGRNPLLRLSTAIARAEARRWPYHTRPRVARHAAHVVGLARPG
jgi:SAM-dependent methyltransferase